MAFVENLSLNMLSSTLFAMLAAVSGYAYRSIRFEQKITGKWEGRLTCSTPRYRSHSIKCTLVLASPKSKSQSGFLYYRRQCTERNQLLVVGIDSLEWLEIRKNGRVKQFSMQFARELHKHPNDRLDYSHSTYLARCRLRKGSNRTLAIEFSTEIPGEAGPDSWSGIFQKS